MYSQPVPAEEQYRERLKQREALAAQRERVHIRLGNIRLALAAVAVLLGWESFGRHAFTAWWILVPVIGFVIIAAYHSRVLRAQELALRAVAFYQRGLARIEERWAGTGQTGERFLDPHHEYAADLDLFGRGSLFELLSTARTRMGEATLANWLLAPAPVSEITVRHSALQELREQIDLWEDVAVLAKDAEAGVHPESLLNWAQAPERLTSKLLPWAALVLALCAVAGAVAWAVWDVATPLLVTILVEAGIFYFHRKAVEDVLHGSEHQFRDLNLLAGVLERIEQQTFTNAHLRSHQHDLLSSELKASQSISRLRSIVNWSEQRENLMVRALDVPLMYSIQVACAAERWRRAHGRAVSAWLKVTGEIEALISLATYSHEHPADAFPEFVSGAACFEATDIGHPLLPEARCVRNSIALCEAAQVLLVSGSNMSGKSTLLRAVGINTVLAMSGAPARATRLRLTPLHAGASIRINDSLQDGSSRFYAEITRIRRLFDLTQGDLPLFFLLDELLQGTNSRDRLIGAEGVIGAFLERRAIGLVSTHDLALTEMGGRAKGRVHNVHFEEDFQDGRMSFDYKLRDGVVTKSNGLELMRSIGLDV